MCKPTSPTGPADTPSAAPAILGHVTWRDDVGLLEPVGPPAPCTDCGIPVVRLATGAIRSTERDMEIDRVACEVASDGYHHLPDVL